MHKFSGIDYSGLASKLTGSICLPGDPGYSETIEVFNALVEKRPKLVVFPKVQEDVNQTIHFAKENKLKITIKNGGHSTFGQCLNEDGIVINMKFLNRVEVEKFGKIARVQAGALLQDLDMATAPFHLAVPAGDCPMVGVTGLILGGGNGFLSRSFGLTCDQLISAVLVTGRGETLLLDPSNNAHIFRAIKGAGQGNFGVITDLILKLSTVPSKIYGASIFWPLHSAEEILQRYAQLMLEAPDELSLYIRLNQDFNGEPAIRLYGMYNGPVKEGKTYFDEIRQWSISLEETFGEYTYYQMQRINEQPSHIRPNFYWKNFFIDELDDTLIKELLSSFQERPTQYCRINLDVLGGQIRQIKSSKTTFIHRDDNFICSIIAVWQNPADAVVCENWCFNSWQKLRGAMSRCYQNYADPYLTDPARSYFGSQLDMLRLLKKELDPENIFVGSLSEGKTE